MSVHDDQAPERPDALADETWHWIVARLGQDRRLLQALTRAFAEELMAIEVDARCRSASGERVNRRNGYRSGVFATPAGTVPVRVPKLRHGGYAPAWLAADADGTGGAFVEALLRGYVEGMSSDLVEAAAAALGIEDVAADQSTALAAAMNARVYAEHVRPLLDVHGDDVVIETKHPAGDVGVAVATTSVHGELDVLGLVIGEHGTGAVDQELRHDLARRGLRGEVPAPGEPPVAPVPRREITIVVRRHGRGGDGLDDVDEPDADDESRPPRRRIPLLLAAAAVVALIAAVVVGSTAVGRLRSDPDPPPVTTVVPVTATAPSTVVASTPPAPAVPPPVTAAAAAAECGPVTGTSRVPWMDQVQCEATAQRTATTSG